MRKGCLLLAAMSAAGITVLFGIHVYRGTVEVAERRDENKAFWYVDERYKRLEKGMTLQEACAILGKGPDDGAGKTRWWLYKDTIVEVEIDGHKRVKRIKFSPASELP